MRTILIAASLSLLACQKSVPVEVQAAPVAVTPIPSAPAPLTHAAYVAAFKGDHLRECVDFTTTAVAPPEGVAVADWKPVFKDLETALREGNAKDKSIKILGMNAPCAESFPGRPIFAKCEQDLPAQKGKDGGSYAVHLISHWFNVDVLDDDATMVECIGDMKGKWTALGHDSPEAARARMRGNAKRLQALGDRFGNQ